MPQPRPTPADCPPTGRLVPFFLGAAATLTTIAVWAWWRLTRQEQQDA